METMGRESDRRRGHRTSERLTRALSLTAVAVTQLVLCSRVASFPFGSPLCLSRIRSRSSHIRLFGKPPPKSKFDLDAIEAFEQQLDTVFVESSSQDVGGALEDDEDLGNESKMYTVPEELDNKRIDTVISSFEPTMSRSHCGNLITDGHVRVVEKDGSTHVVDKKSFKVESGMVLRVNHVSDEVPTEIVAQDIQLDILYEDDCMIVINKSGDMVVHPAAGNWDGTVVNALAYYLANKSPYGSGDFFDVDGSVISVETEGIQVDGTDGEVVSFRPGIVHRLDRGTTGVLVVAKTKAALASLSEAFSSRQVKKTYVAITVGNPGRRVVIDKPIGRHPVHRQRMRVVPDPHKKDSSGRAPKDRLINNKPASKGRRALSFVDTLAFDGKLSVVQVRIETGRTHQIRVHLQDRHTPIYGDDVYGLTDWNKRLSKTHRIERPLLHAHRLELDHPITGERMTFVAPLADDMKRVTKAVWPDAEAERPDLFHND